MNISFVIATMMVSTILLLTAITASAFITTSTTTTIATPVVLQQPKQSSSTYNRIIPPSSRHSSSSSLLFMAGPSQSRAPIVKTLKPASIPLMDSGKALARSGELLIDFTRTLDLYGGALSNAGANIRNAGDCLAQAAASCRFKTGIEIVIDELREAATCLSEGGDRIKLAKDEAAADQDTELANKLNELYTPLKECSRSLEEAGAYILMRKPLYDVGQSLSNASKQLTNISTTITELSIIKSNNDDGILSGQRMVYASTRLNDAGIELRGENEIKKPEGRAFLKGGGF
ncbi:hypothetical protein FRACYDRAFT_245018 [Fragilariopsis cylindrus CCMP1102]|uniref:Pectinesterase inhibitor domain-containing protein n=1 Tax=Fragilariopsis cylindrus CCMP1102 TaxID=635003 RepID=A0A1E7F1A4_9STRA|nr:hypothetical protein FRACYDRAFT_245018 [Fragilariopsis cylindrus CCMP1102]|eukprot:OEU11897.1 hypothetical protein FRACYDRAFT_245018 [Fragilariopsis cylindrus CCMP1102]